MGIVLGDHSLLCDTFFLICPLEEKLRMILLDTASFKVKLPRKAIFSFYVVPQEILRYIYILASLYISYPDYIGSEECFVASNRVSCADSY